MEAKIILCPKCRTPNASGVTNCRGCGIRLCCQCNSAMPPQLGVCPQCGWWDPDWKSPLKDIDNNAPDQKPARVFTKKLEFQCTQCGANVAHDAEKCTVCGYVGHMQLRDKQKKSSIVINAQSASQIRNHSINTKRNALIIDKPRPAAIRSQGKISTISQSKTNMKSFKNSFNSRKRVTTDKKRL